MATWTSGVWVRCKWVKLFFECNACCPVFWHNSWSLVKLLVFERRFLPIWIVYTVTPPSTTFCTSIFSSSPLRWCHPKPFQRSMRWQWKVQMWPKNWRTAISRKGKVAHLRGGKWDFGICGDRKNMSNLTCCYAFEVGIERWIWTWVIGSIWSKQHDLLWWQAVWLGHPNQVYSSKGETYNLWPSRWYYIEHNIFTNHTTNQNADQIIYFTIWVGKITTYSYV